MKTILCFLTAIFLSTALIAKNESFTNRDDEKVQTIFNSVDIWRLSGFGGPTLSFTKIGGEFNLISGGGGGIIINNVFIGGYGESTTTEMDINKGGYSYENLNFGHGGFLLGYEFKPKQVIHPVLSARLGWGNIDALKTSNDEYYNDSFFVITPTISAEINFTRFFKINIGAEYRRTFNVNELDGLSDNDFSGAGVYTSFIFGWF